LKKPFFDFKIQSRCKSTLARVCSIKTPDGIVNTPRFMPVGTLGTVKGVTSDQLKRTGAEMILANTFQLLFSSIDQM
jgi:queuine tRNA-ribosyltransferase